MSRMGLAAPLGGWLLSVRDVPDPVFSEEMLGVGIAIDPVEGILAAPCAARVVLVAPTQHSVTLRTDDGAELLIHIGLETVALQGRGFRAEVREGDQVNAGDVLIAFDLDLVGVEAKSLVTPIVLTNPDEYRLILDPLDRLVERGQEIGSIERTGAAAMVGGGDGEVCQIECLVEFENGLHARPAARIADCAKRFANKITIIAGEKSASARSPVAIMALNVKKGDRVLVTAKGEDGADALDAIAAVLNAGERKAPTARPAPTPPQLAENEIGGVCALPGEAMGTAVHWRRERVEADEPGRGIEQERAALGEARAAVRARLGALGATVDGPAAGIASAHASLLGDEDLNATALAEIERGASAAGAWRMQRWKPPSRSAPPEIQRCRSGSPTLKTSARN